MKHHKHPDMEPSSADAHHEPAATKNVSADSDPGATQATSPRQLQQRQQLEHLHSEDQPAQLMLGRFARRAYGAQKSFYSTKAGSGGGGKPPPKGNSSQKSSHASDTTPSFLEKIRRIQEENKTLEENNARLSSKGGSHSTFRFMDLDKAADYKSPVARKYGDKAHEETMAAVEKSADLKRQLQIGHENMKRYDESPFISTATDPTSAATSGTLDGIVSNAPHLAMIKTGADQLLPAEHEFARRETEHLSLVENLAHNVVGRVRNPYQGGILRLSRITPNMLGHMQQSQETQDRLDPGREARHAARLARMRKRLSKKKTKSPNDSNE